MAPDARRQTQRVDRPLRDAREQRRAPVQAQLDQDGRALALDPRDRNGQDVQDGTVLRWRERHDHLCRPDPQPERAAHGRGKARNQQIARGRSDAGEAVGLVRGDDAGQHRADLVRVEQRGRRRVRQEVLERARPRDPARVDQDQRRRQPRDLGNRVADIQDGDAGAVAEAFHVGQDLRPARGVERGERLVEDQQPRPRQQRAPDRDPRLLAPRQKRGATVEQAADPQHLHHLAARRPGRAGGREAGAVGEVPAHRHVREQPRILEDIADPPRPHGHHHARGAVGQHATIDDDATVIGAQQPRHRVYDRGLARTGASEQRGDPRRRVEGGVEREARKAVPQRDRQHQRPAMRRATARDSHSATPSATSATAIDNAARRATVSPCPGTCSAV